MWKMDPSNVEEKKQATVHGVFVGDLSPIKVSRKCPDRKYFEANLSDGRKTIRMVSFDPNLRKTVEEAHKEKREVAVTKCSVKRGLGDAFEIIANEKTSIVNSPKKFKISDECSLRQAASTSDLETIEGLKDVKEFQRINVVGKVQSISPSEEVKGKGGDVLLKQEFVLADKTDLCRGVIWEEKVNVLKEGTSYKLVNVTVRSFNGARYISLGNKTEIQIIDELGDVVEGDVFDGSGQVKVFKGEIAAVISVEMYTSCRNCSAKVECNEDIVACSKCYTKMKASKCGKKSVARAIVEDTVNREHKVTIFSDTINDIILFTESSSDSEDIGKQLLSAPMLLYTVSPKDIVLKVTRSEVETS